jgi:deoxyadenosine/deoxycytidine kinase
MEQHIPLNYLKRLERLYDDWVAAYDFSEVLVLESDKLDYVGDLIDRQDVRQRVEALLPRALLRAGGRR